MVKRIGQGWDDYPNGMAAQRTGNLRHAVGVIRENPCSQSLAGFDQTIGFQFLVSAAHVFMLMRRCRANWRTEGRSSSGWSCPLAMNQVNC